MKKCFLYFLAILIAVLDSVFAQSHIYLTSPGTSNIRRIDHDGTNAVTLISGINTPRGIELDLTNGKMYFVDGDAGSIRSANLDGTGLNTIITSSSVVDLALDLSSQIIYFTDAVAGKIRKVNFDGTGLADIITGLTQPSGIDLDVTLGVLFWSDFSAHTINSVNTDGTNSQLLFSSTNQTVGLALDKVNQKIYWVERSNDLIRRSDYDGSNVTIIANILAATGLAIDNLNNKVYWNENTSSSLKRMNFDGTGIESVFSNFGLSGMALNINSLLPSLPVEFLEFQGQLEEDRIALGWSTASESNNAGFEVQHAHKRGEWEVLDFVSGHGTSSTIHDYAYQHIDPAIGINYYRLKQVDFDGNYEYSDILELVFEGPTAGILAYPNPSTGTVHLQVNNPQNLPMKLSLTDQLGRRVWEGEWQQGLDDWDQVLEMKDVGMYYLTAWIGKQAFHEVVIVRGE